MQLVETLIILMRYFHGCILIKSNRGENMQNVIGVDIGGTNSAVILGNTNNEILKKFRFKTEPKKGPDYALNKIYYYIRQILNINSACSDKFASIGISCGGPLNREEGIILSPPNLPGWDEIPIVKELECRFKINTYLENDANASALAEKKFGIGKGYKNIIFLTFGTGLGAGLILNDALYSGTNDLAGEIGHIRLENSGPEGYGKEGSFEGFCSGGGLVNLAKIILKEKNNLGLDVKINNVSSDALTAKDICIAANKGNQVAREILAYSGKYLGYGISILIDIFNPEIIIIGSIFYRSRKFIEPAALNIIEQEALSIPYNNCKIEASQLKERIGDYACLTVALENT